ncbi:MAG: hypothetical protein QOJ70_1808 [Acidobacteriota bacterium]|jgi:hypothetical protein|nr:hypothetical protein [Acidobacteriota bacterium]
MMLTTPETMAEAKQALHEFMLRERHASLARENRAGANFQTEGDSDTPFDNRDGWGPILDEARESARRYIASKSKNARPVRPVDESSPAAVEGQIQALTWLKRRGKSRLKP